MPSTTVDCTACRDNCRVGFCSNHHRQHVEPDMMENHRSYKGKAVATRKALEWANLNNNTEDVTIALGVPFLSTVWNGSQNLPVWLAYDISATDEGWTITSYRWYTNPNKEI